MNTVTRSFSYAFILATLFGAMVSVTAYAHAAYEIEQIPGGDQVFGDFVVGPTKIELDAEPGKERVVELMVTNRMGEPKLFSLGVEDAKGSDNPEQTVVLLGDDRGPYSLKDYLSFPETSFVLNQGERARIPVTIRIPADAQPGGLYGSVLVTTSSVPKVTDENGTVQVGAKPGSVIVSRVGVLFFVTVPGAVERAGQLARFATIPDQKVFSHGPIRFQTVFENTGSVHLNPSGTVTIKNILGEEVGTVTADPWFAFPQSKRTRELVWNRPYLFGYYTAEASIDRGYDHIIDTATVSFIVIPWMLIATAFGVLAVFIFFVRFIMRTFEIKKRV